MMKKTAVIISWFLLAVILMTGCAKETRIREETRPETDGYSVAVGTDLHYLSPALTDYGDLFWQVVEAGDGKVTEYCEEITDAFFAEVIRLRPDALILTGDLSFNGEKESHLALAVKLKAVEETGIPVLVLPGNHDMYRTCYSLFGEKSSRTDTVDSEEFSSIYAEFGFDEAISRDTDSLSYMAQLSKNTRVLMLDANTTHDFCSLSDKTLRWIDGCLSQAEADGQDVLIACHQNLLQHSMFVSGYVLECADELHILMEKHHVPLIISGHLHIQHIASAGSVTEIATSALTMGECHYGKLELQDGALHYETVNVTVSGCVSKQGSSQEDIIDFRDYAFQRMERRNRGQATEQLMQKGMSEERVNALADYACDLNYAYFSGNLKGIADLDPDGSLLTEWKESGTFFGYYFATIENEIGKDYTQWEENSQ